MHTGLKNGERVVFFDGDCRLCNGWARFILEHDRDGRFLLCPIESPKGRALLEVIGFDVETAADTMVVVDMNGYKVKSSAALMVLGQLPFPWRFLAAGILVPAWIRDRIYDWFAKNRYGLFGRANNCIVPDDEMSRRFYQ